MENVSKQRQRQSWYKNGLRFECQRCGNCCRGEPGVVRVDREDIRKISSVLNIDRESFAKQYLRIVNGGISLREYRNGDCFMYDNGCKIYTARPLQCRTFPFWKSNLSNKEEWEQQKRTCPGMEKGRLHPQKEIEGVLATELNES
ncbi:MAG: YkgJ family cysteine cluster protein [Planctomycetes bacterium]|nr:YkgJ family cysteine cluster protein [Planctomycetota bacterium]